MTRTEMKTAICNYTALNEEEAKLRQLGLRDDNPRLVRIYRQRRTILECLELIAPLDADPSSPWN